MKTIVIYYSHSGNTEKAAKAVAEKTNSQLLRIEPVKDIPQGASKFLIGGAQACMKKRPEFRQVGFVPDEFDGIILGTPIWAGKCAPVLMTFLEQYGASDKVFAVFALSGGGNISYAEKMKEFLPKLKLTVGLADSSNAKAAENDGIIERFSEEICRIESI